MILSILLTPLCNSSFLGAAVLVWVPGCTTMANIGSMGDPGLSRMSIASQFFSGGEETTGIDTMTTSERVSPPDWKQKDPVVTLSSLWVAVPSVDYCSA